MDKKMEYRVREGVHKPDKLVNNLMSVFQVVKQDSNTCIGVLKNIYTCTILLN